MDYISHYDSPLGGMTLACDGAALTGCWFDGQAHFGDGLDPMHTKKAVPLLQEAAHWLDLYFAGKEPDICPPLAPRGTPFRLAIWKALAAIPYGCTTTYGALAEKLRKQGFPRASARAVGGAVAHNPLLLFLPCHRVLAADGSLTGYAAGVERKRWLLEKEKGM